LGIHEGIAACNTHAVAFAQFFKNFQVRPYLAQGFVTRPPGISVTALTTQVAVGGRFQPGSAIVSVIPWQAIIFEMV
jgi:hypothetical protein